MPYGGPGPRYGSRVRVSMPELLWTPAGADADQVLADQVRARHAGTVRIGRLCPRCSSSTHGRPWARAGAVDIPVSVSRAGEYLVSAVAEPGTGMLGVDVEVDDPDRRWPWELMLASGESVADAHDALRLWVAKEAVLKAMGVGFARAMSDVVLAEFDGSLWEAPAPPGYAAAVAVARVD